MSSGTSSEDASLLRRLRVRARVCVYCDARNVLRAASADGVSRWAGRRLCDSCATFARACVVAFCTITLYCIVLHRRCRRSMARASFLQWAPTRCTALRTASPSTSRCVRHGGGMVAPSSGDTTWHVIIVTASPPTSRRVCHDDGMMASFWHHRPVMSNGMSLLSRPLPRPQGARAHLMMPSWWRHQHRVSWVSPHDGVMMPSLYRHMVVSLDLISCRCASCVMSGHGRRPSPAARDAALVALGDGAEHGARPDAARHAALLAPVAAPPVLARRLGCVMATSSWSRRCHETVSLSPMLPSPSTPLL